VFKRDPSIVEDMYVYRSQSKGYQPTIDEENVCQLESLIIDYPHKVAELLDAYGFTPYSLMEECQIDDMSQYYNYYDSYGARLGKKYLG
jgi:hypothetical protein